MSKGSNRNTSNNKTLSNAKRITMKGNTRINNIMLKSSEASMAIVAFLGAGACSAAGRLPSSLGVSQSLPSR
eukprot:556966-Alexandrium_andersonii.AAC.1